MKIPIYQVDAFASELFTGNPAAVCPLESWLDDAMLQAIAAENNLSETAFIVARADGYELRWFTPTVEVALCGHATLASASVVFDRLGHLGDRVLFHTRWSGNLVVCRKGELLELDFPVRPVRAIDPGPGLARALGVAVDDVFSSEEDLMVVLPAEKDVLAIRPDFVLVERVAQRGVIVTALGTSCDFVSRFFAPGAGIPEDPVTGSAHCVLAPYWAERLGKLSLHARQVSRRGGELWCEVRDERVLIAGRAVLYLEGEIIIPTYS